MHAEACGHALFDASVRYTAIRHMLGATSLYERLYVKARQLLRKMLNSLRRDVTSSALSPYCYDEISIEEVKVIAKDMFEHLSHPNAEAGVFPSSVTAHVPDADYGPDILTEDEVCSKFAPMVCIRHLIPVYIAGDRAAAANEGRTDTTLYR